MIPVRLSLRNFMSYGDEPTTLDLTGVHVACLAGDNGNGKSAILDAITYSLWGRTRASGSAASGEDDLIRLGAGDLEVQLDFRLEDVLYRTIRKRSRGKGGDWQLQIFDGNGAWLPVGGTGMKETERQIVRILRMEHETFLNSAYFQQGRADEFTRQKPEARKRILADILDLKRYDRLSEIAKGHRDECATAITELDGEIRVFESRMANEPGLTGELKQQESSLQEQITSRDQQEKRIIELRSKLSAGEEKARRLKEAEQRLTHDQTAIRHMEEELIRLRERLVILSSILDDQERIRSEYGLLSQSREKASELETSVQLLNKARQDRVVMERLLDTRKFELSQEITKTESELKFAEQQAAEAERLRVQIDAAKQILIELGPIEATVAKSRTDLERAVTEFAELRSENARLKEDIEDFDKVLGILAKPRPQCPVCERELNDERKATVVERQTNKRSKLIARQQEIKSLGIELNKRKDDLEKQVAALEVRVREAGGIRLQIEDLSKRQAELPISDALLMSIRARLDVQHKQMSAGEYGLNERSALKEIDTRISSLETSERELAAIKVTLKDLLDRRVETSYAQLMEAETNCIQLKSELSDREKLQETRRGGILAEEKRLGALREELAGFSEMHEEALSQGQEFAKLTAVCEAALTLVSRTRQALEDCQKARVQREKKQLERDKIAKDKQAYSELASAFGRSGVQALIIHNVLPEIEEEANRLLARMTENSMKVTLDTQRSSRSGSSQIETLDIRITDDAGTRPYEMFSGGEAFRVNFALRIALSRLLARRAGARLQTLIIDEGFGTQDAKGRERLVEAIQTVQDEFALILVITHIEDLKDAFPTRIDVIRTSAGSQIVYVD